MFISIFADLCSSAMNIVYSICEYCLVVVFCYHQFLKAEVAMVTDQRGVWVCWCSLLLSCVQYVCFVCEREREREML